MGFRNPVTSATAVDTGAGGNAGVRLYQGEAAPGVPQGIAEWRTGLMDRNATVTLSGGTGGSAFIIDGGAAQGLNAPKIQADVESAPAGGYRSVARVTGADLFDLTSGDVRGIEPKVLSSIPARDAWFTGDRLRAGAAALVAGEMHVYDGAAWRFWLEGYARVVADASGFLSIPHGGGQTPVRFGCSATGQDNDTVSSLVSSPLAWSADSSTVFFRAYRVDTRAPFAGNAIQVNWWAKF